MNRRLLPIVLFAAIAIASASITVFACGDKATSASNAAAGKSAVAAGSNGACTAAMAAKCTAEMAAACKAKGASAAMGQCPYHNSNAAVTAEQVSDHCAKNGAAAAAATPSCCSAKGAKTSAASASAGGACGTKMSASGGSCSAHGKTSGFDAMSTGGTACGGKGIGAMAGGMSGHGCDACADMMACESELKTIGSQYQVVPLKNGVMYVYTADDPRGVRGVQSAIARRTERINALVTADNAKLCPDCKQMRGAMASGKLTREVINIEGGSISLVTSSDPAMVARLYAMAGLSSPKGVKS